MLIYISILLLSLIVICGGEPVVDTTHGKLTGKVLKTLYEDKEYYGFMGIPFAAPPVNELRFLPPQPLEPWSGVLEATKEKEACAQFNFNIKKGRSLSYYGSEDCLYLDIFTPAVDNDKRNVIVFIYNENFSNSYNKSKDYQPDFFIEEDVLVVTISHRLTAMGFLSLEDETLWGNSGLKDIVAALEWVRHNIEKFGGDPDKVTLLGRYGGAAAVNLLLHSKKKHLFKSAIMQSGNAWSTLYLQENTRERAFKLAKLFDKHPTTSQSLIEELNNIPLVNITRKDIHANPDDYFKETQRSVAPFGPVVEKDPNGLVTDYPENTSEITTPILIGFNNREGLEGSLHYLMEPRYMSFLNKDFPILFPTRADFRFDPFKDGYKDAVEDIKQFYFKDGKIRISRVSDYINYMSDVINSYAIDYSVRFYSKISKAPIFYYYFGYVGEFNENSMSIKQRAQDVNATWGAASGDELCYLFKCPDLTEVYLKHQKTMSEERRTQMKMVKLWTNFAKYGNPTPDKEKDLDGLKWPPYTNELKQYLRIGKTMEIKTDVKKNNFEFWDQFYEKWRQKAENGVVSYIANVKDEL